MAFLQVTQRCDEHFWIATSQPILHGFIDRQSAIFSGIRQIEAGVLG